MVGIEKTAKRPFEQSRYDLNNIGPTFSGPHYKFIVVLPVTEKFEGEKDFRPVFTIRDLSRLEDLFNDDFGGVTINKGPVKGSWRDDDEGKICINEHVRLEIYTKLHPDAEEYFTELKVRLLEHAKEIRHMPQKEIVIERVVVDFVPQTTKEQMITKLEERLKNLKR